MAEYYLISQLPSLDGISENMPLPINEERFLELCDQHLGKKSRSEIEKLTIVPPQDAESVGSVLLKEWYEGERNLRIALLKVRAEKMNKAYDLQNKSLPVEVLKVANEASSEENPMRAENMLFEYRLKLLESLRPMDTFSEDFVFYYGLKLKLITRMKQFDSKLGEIAYRDIYNSILDRNRTEEML